MRHLSILCLACLLSTPAVVLAQQGVTRPVLSAPTADQTPAAAPAPLAAPSQPQNGAPVASSYILGPDDAIQVVVWKEPTLSNALSIRPDGMISLPLIGDLPAAGLTPMALGADITAKLKKFITDPVVTVSVTTVNSKRIFLLGEVGRVGPLPLAPGMTILQAISSAGGLGPFANAKHLYILRTVGGKQQKIPFNYKKAVKDGDLQGIALMNGDTIVAP